MKLPEYHGWKMSSMDGFPTQTSIGDYSIVSIYDFPMFIGISQLATKEMPWGYAETVPPRRSKMDPAKALEISLSHSGPWQSLGFMIFNYEFI